MNDVTFLINLFHGYIQGRYGESVAEIMSLTVFAVRNGKNMMIYLENEYE